jgi:hypothetical protein
METSLTSLSTVVTVASTPERDTLIIDCLRRTARVTSFFGMPLGALDPYTDTQFPRLP